MASGSVGMVEYGDFQTPLPLARRICRLLSATRIPPATIVEPSCGVGSFLVAAAEAFPQARRIVGIDINQDYLGVARTSLHVSDDCQVELLCESFFDTDWNRILRDGPEPILCVGNPPWVTNAVLGGLGSSNLPVKKNIRCDKGIEAITGKGNFDISEWLIIRLLGLIKHRQAAVAMLCKRSVARKALAFAWDSGFRLSEARMYLIDAAAYFSVSADACLLVCSRAASDDQRCGVYPSLESDRPGREFGMAGRDLVADFDAYERTKHLRGKCAYKWRSGIKHDCSRIMEFQRTEAGLVNGFGDTVDLEDDYVFPLLKGSELANGSLTPKRRMLVTQFGVGHETAQLRYAAPRTWAYLQRYAEMLDRRSSSIYKGRPRFSVFGVGPYAFAPWKVGVPALYKQMIFRAVGPHVGRPVVLDDTCYFVPCQTEGEAVTVARILNSDLCRLFFQAYVFWDNKRPITAEILSRLDIRRAAGELGEELDIVGASGAADGVPAEGMLF